MQLGVRVGGEGEGELARFGNCNVTVYGGLGCHGRFEAAIRFGRTLLQMLANVLSEVTFGMEASRAVLAFRGDFILGLTYDSWMINIATPIEAAWHHLRKISIHWQTPKNEGSCSQLLTRSGRQSLRLAGS